MDRLLATRWAEIDTLFAQALDRPDDERTAFLRARCGDDPALYDAVCALLDADADAERALGESATDFAAHLLGAAAGDDALDLVPGTRIGPYQIEGELGRGGMGTVYRAARADGTFEKAVALKLVKRGMDTDEVLRRFRYERHVLAGLDHPNVARLLDAGAADDGRPYLVMELVEGEPLTGWAEARDLGVEQRLGLFEQVCAAVAYAHRHLVVHRDLKPSNVLVAEDERGAPHVKLLDFGVARLLEDEPDDAPRTRAEQRILTPEYAAPEQFEGGTVTTATDVYALGVVLYELLTGQRPGASPKRPSDLTPERGRTLRGDLDTLTLKALHPDPARRYPSAEALLDDLRRRHNGLPLQARPDRVGYRVRKFVGRHRWGVGVATAGVLALVGFLVALTVQQRETARERDRAQATAAFLQDLFDAADPFAAGSDRPDTLRARDLLGRGVQRARVTLADQPTVQAQMLQTVGSVYGSLGLYEEADTLLAEAVALQRTHLGPHAPDVAASLRERGRVQTTQGHFEESERLLREALALEREASGPRSAAVAETLVLLAESLRRQARTDEAEPLLREALAIQQEQSDELETTSALIELGRVHQARGTPAEAEPLYRDLVALHRRLLPPGHPRLSESLTMLADVLGEQHRLDEAEPLFREALTIREQALGSNHLHTASAKFNLAVTLSNKGEYGEALKLYEEVGAFNRATLDPDHPYVGLNLNTIGITHARMGNHKKALEHHEAALAFFGRTLPPTHPYAIEALAGKGVAQMRLGQLSSAEASFRRALALFEESSGPTSWRTGIAQSALGECLTRMERFDEAEPLLLSGYETVRNASGPVAPTLRRLIFLYERTGQPDEAARYRALLPE